MSEGLSKHRILQPDIHIFLGEDISIILMCIPLRKIPKARKAEHGRETERKPVVWGLRVESYKMMAEK